MNAKEFRARYSRVDAEVEWIELDERLLRNRGVAELDIETLRAFGLPRKPAFLKFKAFVGDDLNAIQRLLAAPTHFYPLGSDSDAVVGLQTATRVVHQRRYGRDEIIFVNASLSSLLEALCLIAENERPEDFLRKLEGIDARACASGAFWRGIADDLIALNSA